MHRLLVVSSFVLCSLVSGSRVVLEDNGFQGVVVAISDQVPQGDCRTVVESIERIFQNASTYLHRATRQRAYFRNVTILLPSTWDVSCSGKVVQASTVETYDSADIRVSSRHPVYHDGPWTQQSQGCGKQGDFIYLPENFVAPTDDSVRKLYGDPGRALVHEWAKYRWGVFEEYGLPGDPMYPSFFQTGRHDWTPTGCSDVPVAGNVYPSDCDERSNKCSFRPLEGSANKGVRSSLMYLQYLENVDRFCDGNTHKAAAPTKHNLLCGGRSTWDVIQQSSDFKDNENPPSDSPVPAPVFQFVQARPSRFIYILEDTRVMSQQERWDFITGAFRIFVTYDIPVGTMIGSVRFNSEGHTQHPLEAVTEDIQQRNRLANMPIHSNNDIQETQKCWICGLHEAIRNLEIDDRVAAGGTVVWITGNQLMSTHAPTDGDVRDMIHLAKEKQITVVIIFYPSVTPGLERVAMETGGGVYVVEDASIGIMTKVSVLNGVINSLMSSLNANYYKKEDLSLLVHSVAYPGSQLIKGRFEMDPTLGRDTYLTVLSHDKRDFGDLKIKSPSQSVLTPQYFTPDNSGYMVYYFISDAESGTWEYEIGNYANSHMKIYVKVSSKPRFSDTIRTRVWTNAEEGSVDAFKGPLIIYAEVKQGESAVLGAEVYASVNLATNNSSDVLRIRLLDDGKGTPDLMHGDGVYSRYFTSFSSPKGIFGVAVEVHSVAGETGVVASPTRLKRTISSNGDPPFCCGSTVGNVATRPVRSLTRDQVGPMVNVVGAPTPGSGDHYPPNRVTDLRTVVLAAAKQIKFSWTAPGDDFDLSDTKANFYDVRFSSNRDQLIKNFDMAAPVTPFPTPELTGTPSTHTISFNHYDAMYYFALRAIDDNGNKAQISNIVSVYMPQPPVSSTQFPTTLPSKTTTPPTPLDKSHKLAIILGSVAGFIALIILILIYYCLCCKQRRKPDPNSYVNHRHMNGGSTEVLQRPNGVVQVDRNPTPVKDTYALDHEVQVISDGKNGGQILSPIQSWSATQLLSEHSRKSSPVTMETNGNGILSADNNHINSIYGSRPNGRSSRYNSYQTPYIEDVNMYSDGRSLVSTQPSDSFVSLNSDNNARVRHNNTNTDYETCWEGDRDANTGRLKNGSAKMPPPTLPKPNISHLGLNPNCNPTAQGSNSSINSDRKRRNVTQV